MANQIKGEAQLVNRSYSSKQYGLPPKSPFPMMGLSFQDCGPASCTGRKESSHLKGGYRQHQRTPSESSIIEEQPSWLDDLLNEPETPVKKGTHRRSASDSIALLEVPDSFSGVQNVIEEKLNFNTLTSIPLQGSLDFDQLDEEILTSIFSKAESTWMPPNNSGEGFLNSCSSYEFGGSSSRVNCKPTYLDLPFLQPLSKHVTFPTLPHVGTVELDISAVKGSSFERRGSTSVMLGDPDMDPKRANWTPSSRQTAQRSRVRKLQYISELERIVRVLQAEESEMSAEAAFLNQLRLILTLDNKVLKQRIAVLAQEKLIKDAQRESLTEEAQRLALLYCHQQQCQQHSSLQLDHLHHNPTYADFDAQWLQFSNLSLASVKKAEPGPAHSGDAFGLLKHPGNVS